jgi:4-hydroxy-2-oxoheptanedioate aldolase
MNKLFSQIKILKKLGAVAIKQSLEDEGANFDEITFMRELTKKQGLKLNVKIGGCEAKNDIFFCQSIKSDGIVVPMVESEYNLTKFIQTVSSEFKGDLYMNLESINGFKNLSKIINTNEFNKLKGIVIGRSDLAGSLNLSKSRVNSRKIFNLVEDGLKKIKRKKKLVKIGGNMTVKSKKFINELFSAKLIDRAETRNIEFKINKNTLKNFDMIIYLILKFEIEWLKYKNTNFVTNNYAKKANSKRIADVFKR